MAKNISSASLPYNPTMRIDPHQIVYCLPCGWRHLKGERFANFACPTCGNPLSIVSTEILTASLMDEPLPFIRLPDSRMREFRDLDELYIAHLGDRLVLLLRTVGDLEREWTIPDMISEEKAREAEAAFEAYSKRLVNKYPRPGSESAKKVRCTCRKTWVHEPHCVVAQADFSDPFLRLQPDKWTDPTGDEIPFSICDGICIDEIDEIDKLTVTGGGKLRPDGYAFSVIDEIEPLGPGDVYRHEADLVFSMWEGYVKTHGWQTPDGHVILFKDCDWVGFEGDNPTQILFVYKPDNKDGLQQVRFNIGSDRGYVEYKEASRIIGNWNEHCKELGITPPLFWSAEEKPPARLPMKMKDGLAIWTSPVRGERTYDFRDLDEISLTGRALYIIGKGGERRYKVPQVVNECEARRLEERWEQFLSMQVEKEPHPQTPKAIAAGCLCRSEFRHNPDCPVLIEELEHKPVKGTVPMDAMKDAGWVDPEGEYISFEKCLDVGLHEEFGGITLGLHTDIMVYGYKVPDDIPALVAVKVIAAWNKFLDDKDKEREKAREEMECYTWISSHGNTIAFQLCDSITFDPSVGFLTFKGSFPDSSYPNDIRVFGYDYLVVPDDTETTANEIRESECKKLLAMWDRFVDLGLKKPPLTPPVRQPPAVPPELVQRLTDLTQALTELVRELKG